MIFFILFDVLTVVVSSTSDVGRSRAPSPHLPPEQSGQACRPAAVRWATAETTASPEAPRSSTTRGRDGSPPLPRVPEQRRGNRTEGRWVPDTDTEAAGDAASALFDELAAVGARMVGASMGKGKVCTVT